MDSFHMLQVWAVDRCLFTLASLNLLQYKTEVSYIVAGPSATPLTATLWTTDLNNSFQGLFAYVKRLSNDIHGTC